MINSSIWTHVGVQCHAGVDFIDAATSISLGGSDMSEFRFQLPVHGFTAPQIPGITPTGRHRRRCVLRRRIAIRHLIARAAIFAALIAAGCEAIIEGGDERA